MHAVVRVRNRAKQKEVERQIENDKNKRLLLEPKTNVMSAAVGLVVVAVGAVIRGFILNPTSNC